MTELGSRARAGARPPSRRPGCPSCAIVGYTNAGKSTLLNALTDASVLAEDKLFATLDPTSRRLRFPQEREGGGHRHGGLHPRPAEGSLAAFRATLEELESADLLLQVVDAGHAELAGQVEAVEAILKEMELDNGAQASGPQQMDSLDDDRKEWALSRYPEGIPISARNRKTLEPLVDTIVRRVDWEKGLARSGQNG